MGSCRMREEQCNLDEFKLGLENLMSKRKSLQDIKILLECMLGNVESLINLKSEDRRIKDIIQDVRDDIVYEATE